MTILIAGASGATGRLLTEELLNRGENVKIIVRRTDSLPEKVLHHKNLSTINASILNMSNDEIKEHIKDCDALVSCLGHNISFKGIYGPPRRLVTEAVRRLCLAVEAYKPEKKVKFVLMSTSGYRNPDFAEKISLSQKIVIGVLRTLLPPLPDNEKAADYLRVNISQDNRFIEWVAVRPDSLINEAEVSPYETHPSPIRSAIFDPGKTSRINVAHFMAELICNEDIWNRWKGQMPLIYNR